MKNLFLSTAFALLSVASFAQELTRSLITTLAAVEEVDSISVWKLSGDYFDQNPELKGLINWDQITFTKVNSYKGDFAFHCWEEAGTYMLCGVKGGKVVNERVYFVINDEYVDSAVEYENKNCGSSWTDEDKTIISRGIVPIGKKTEYVVSASK